jgi:hypothetical protein
MAQKGVLPQSTLCKSTSVSTTQMNDKERLARNHSALLLIISKGFRFVLLLGGAIPGD